MAIAKVLSSGKTFPSSTLAKLLVSLYKTKREKNYMFVNEGKAITPFSHTFNIGV